MARQTACPRLLQLQFAEFASMLLSERLAWQCWSLILKHRLQEAVAALMRAGLRNPFRVNVAVSSAQHKSATASAASQKTPLSLEITYTIVPGNEKVSQLLAFLNANRKHKVIVYFLTCASVEYFSLALPALPGAPDMTVLALHGSLKQKKACATPPTPAFPPPHFQVKRPIPEHPPSSTCAAL